MTLKSLMLSLALATQLFTPAHAATTQPFSQEAFDRAREAGQTIVLAYHLGGCSTCATQEPRLQSALAPLPDAKVAAFRVDFDPKSSIAKTYGVVKQSTLVVLKGGELKGKEIGVTDESKIRALLAKGL